MDNKTLMSDQDFLAMQEYKKQHGRDWKQRLERAWLCDWREQWGILRSIRNNPEYAGDEGFAGIFKVYARTAKAKGV